MMTIPVKTSTVEEFDAFIELPENLDRNFEYIGGEIVEVPSNPFASKISGIFFGEIYIFNKSHNLGHMTGEAGGYQVSGERYAPDVGFVSKARQEQIARQGYNLLPPDLAVEVHHSSAVPSQDFLRIKMANYLAAGTTVWIADPLNKKVQVYEPGKPVVILGIDDTLDGGNILPGFKLAVKDVFPE
jgi:Uma2 family endonuclease